MPFFPMPSSFTSHPSRLAFRGHDRLETQVAQNHPLGQVQGQPHGKQNDTGQVERHPRILAHGQVDAHRPIHAPFFPFGREILQEQAVPMASQWVVDVQGGRPLPITLDDPQPGPGLQHPVLEGRQAAAWVIERIELDQGDMNIAAGQAEGHAGNQRSTDQDLGKKVAAQIADEDDNHGIVHDVRRELEHKVLAGNVATAGDENRHAVRGTHECVDAQQGQQQQEREEPGRAGKVGPAVGPDPGHQADIVQRREKDGVAIQTDIPDGQINHQEKAENHRQMDTTELLPYNFDQAIHRIAHVQGYPSIIQAASETAPTPAHRSVPAP
ncbi:hypothetical protein DESC_590095 [Desulfosarcina cetonica]|nr:hypothetical protein DESC_590095 [Desulfosarcina cetonica]